MDIESQKSYNINSNVTVTTVWEGSKAAVDE